MRFANISKHAPLEALLRGLRRTGLRGTMLAAALSAVVAMLPTVQASAASEIRGLATAHLSLRRAEGSTLIETGRVSGAISGSVRARLNTRSRQFTAAFSISTSAGTITGTGSATPSGTGRYQSFHGSFRATSGSGRYAHIRGEARLYGVFDRQTDSVVVQTVGSLSY